MLNLITRRRRTRPVPTPPAFAPHAPWPEGLVARRCTVADLTDDIWVPVGSRLVIEDHGCVQTPKFGEGLHSVQEFAAKLKETGAGKSAKAIWHTSRTIDVALPTVSKAGATAAAITVSIRLVVIAEGLPSLLDRCSTEHGSVDRARLRVLLEDIIRREPVPIFERVEPQAIPASLGAAMTSYLNNSSLRGLGIAAESVLVQLSERRDDGREMARLDPGTLTMGSPESENGGLDEMPHLVRIRHGFSLDISPVTNAEYWSFVSKNPEWQKCRFSEGSDPSFSKPFPLEFPPA